MKKIKALVLLAGCGSKDGAEIREAVITLLALDKEGVAYQCAAPNIQQHHVLNFIDNSEMQEQRNVLVEAARIARGDILDLSTLSMQDYDALVLPGGFGVAKNFCGFAFDGAKASVNPIVKSIIEEAYELNKVILAICISPALVALSLASQNPELILSLGTDPKANQALTQMGVQFRNCLSTECIVDEKHKIISSPAYMHDQASLCDLETGINKAVKAMIKMF